MAHGGLLPRTRRQVGLGIRGQLSITARFYEDLERAVAGFFPSELDRPRVHVAIGPGMDLARPRATAGEVIDLELVPRGESPSRSSFSSAALLEALYEHGGGRPRALPASPDAATDPLAAYEVEIVAPAAGAARAVTARTGTARLGVLGGMGPLAGASFLRGLEQEIQKSLGPRAADVEIALYSNPTFPSTRRGKLKALFTGGGRGLVAYRGRLIAFLRRPDVDFYVVPCNTFHRNFAWANERAGGRMVSLVEAVAEETLRVHGRRRVMLLATNQTTASDMYPRAFARRGGAIAFPGAAEQQQVQAGIDAVKAGDLGRARFIFDAVVGAVLAGAGASRPEVLVLGCTEIPMAATRRDDVAFVDSVEVLTRATVARLGELLAKGRPVR